MRLPWLYRALSRLTFLDYGGKIMLVAFVGTHVPLVVLVCYLALLSTPGWPTFIATVGVTLIATLVGTSLMLVVLYQLLQPILLTSRALRRYRQTREKIDLPTKYRDVAGVLMADAVATIEHLERARELLENVDEATSLPNRKRLLEIIMRRAQTAAQFSVRVVRFSNFVRIVETIDLARANQAAVELAERLQHEAGPGMLLARIGASDFALVRSEPDDDDHTASTFDGLRALIGRCSDELTLDAFEIKPELVAGVARFPDDAIDAETLLDHAIAAAAQTTLGRPVVQHSAEARDAAFKRLTIEQQLRRALDNHEFFLCYQPVVDFEHDRVVAGEALLRWQHPDRGLVSPAEFIPAAESSGLIVPIGQWVMESACAQLRAWDAAGLEGVHIAINLSARQFLDDGLGAQIGAAIERNGIDARRIELELTETSAMHDVAYTRRMLSRLRDLGVRVAIDDFGTGYASMSYLRNLPFDRLKIDREFVTDVHERADGQAICRSIIALSQGFGLEVLAEGTEKLEEVHYLSAQGCGLFQGYYFARPLIAEEFAGVYHCLPGTADAGRRPSA